MKKTFTVMLAVLTMLACSSCMDRTRDNTGYWNNTNPNVNPTPGTVENYVEPTPGTVDSLDYLR